MKILTWNMGYWQHPKVHDEAWEYHANELKPDIAFLQETIPPDDQEKSGRVLWSPIKRRTWGSCIFSPELELKKIDLNSFQYRGWVQIAEVVGEEEPIILASIHVPIINNWAYPYIEEIFELIDPFISGNRFIVGGDLNSCRLIDEVQGSKHHNAFFDRIETNGYFNCVKKFYPEEPQTFFGKQAKNPYQDDHLFVDEASSENVLSCEVLDYVEPLSAFSDHAPIVMELD